VENKTFLLDTSALFCLRDDETGADKVESILEESKKGKAQTIISFMTAMEYLYINLIRYDEETARRSYLELTLLPITIIESQEEIRLAAAELKAKHAMSVADAWIAATALSEQAILVHKDPEYESLPKNIKQLTLPYKKS
jgi:ribonuclease VapC